VDLDALLSYQNYPVLAAYNSTMKRRPLGVGIINLAYWLAKNNTGYENPNLVLIDEYAEAWSYYLIKASADLLLNKELFQVLWKLNMDTVLLLIKHIKKS
jgi:ribonucleoside-diphosphate reductase alpha chain